MVKILHPEYYWDEERFHTHAGASKSQYFLHSMIESILPIGDETTYNYVASFLRYERTLAFMRMDVWLPKYNIAIEYQAIKAV
jgi:hypothetical protein